MNPGLLYCVLAFGMWGTFPLYFRALSAVPALEMVLHRCVWSVVFLLAILALRRHWGWLLDVVRRPRSILVFAGSAALLLGNWFVYVYSVQNGHVVEASLGYFINPLLNVMLGVLVLHERLRRPQWAAVALAAAGVLWLTWQTGRLPWIALVLAGSFALYGLIRKTASLGALEGLTVENLVVAPIVLPALIFWTASGQGALAGGDVGLMGLLVLAGPLTALPLLLFAAGARRLPLATVGLLQYISPSLQLALGIWVFHEPFDADRLVGFACIWAGLVVYSVDALLRSRAAAAAAAPATPNPG
jgi:chloramphenicol-sensitive protein RarD